MFLPQGQLLCELVQLDDEFRLVLDDFFNCAGSAFVFRVIWVKHDGDGVMPCELRLSVLELVAVRPFPMLCES